MKKPCATVDNFHEIEGIRSGSGLFLGLGVLMTLLGFGAIVYSSLATIASVVFLGGLFLSAGIAHFVYSCWVREWKGVFISLLLAIFLGIIGLICIYSPLQASAALTLLIGAYFFVAGLVRMVSALFLRFERWGWFFINGLISFFLGILIFSGWPASALWIIGLFIGIDIFLAGISWIYLAHSLVRE
jgi:uncharacterized membrane protein HdeD (DUF308 family)